jgi:hypothetical protein
MTAVPVAHDAGAQRWLAALVLAVAVTLSGANGAGAVDEAAMAASDSASVGSVPTAAAPGDSAAVAVPASEPVAGGEPEEAGGPTGPVAPAGEPEVPAVDMWDTGVNATTAVLVTPLFPGWGQLYSDGGWRAALAFGTEMYFWSNLLTRDRQSRRDQDYADTLSETDPNRAIAEAMALEHHEQMKDFMWWSGGALLIIALDAYVGAHLYNFDQDPVPVPDRWDDLFGPVGSGAVGAAGVGPEVTVFQWRKGF